MVMNIHYWVLMKPAGESWITPSHMRVCTHTHTHAGTHIHQRKFMLKLWKKQKDALNIFEVTGSVQIWHFTVDQKGSSYGSVDTLFWESWLCLSMVFYIWQFSWSICDQFVSPSASCSITTTQIWDWDILSFVNTFTTSLQLPDFS